MAAGLGTRLAPLTDHLPKPLVPVCNRPVLEHLLRRLAVSGVEDVAVNLHWHADAIRDTFGDGGRLGLRIHYLYEEELLGTAGGTRMFDDLLGADGEPFYVTSADGLLDVDLRALARRHREAGGIGTLTVKQVADPSRFGVCVLDDDVCITGFQEKPSREEARSDLASCGVYVFEPRVFGYIERGTFADWAKNVLPAAMADGERLAAYVTDAYWNDVGTVAELLASNLDALGGGLDLGLGALIDPSAQIHPEARLEGEVMIGAGAQIGRGAQLIGPVVVGQGARVGEGAALRSSVLLPGAVLADGALLVGGVGGDCAPLSTLWR